MSVNFSNNVNKAGVCPHGLPHGSCPICSGGGVISMDRNTRRNAGELTWNECYAIGQMMKAAQARNDLAVLQQQNAQLQNAQIQNAALRFAQAFSSIVNFVTNFPPIKIVFTGVKSLIGYTVNFMKVTTHSFVYSNFFNLKNVLVDISDKLAAIFGEDCLAKIKNLQSFIARAVMKTSLLFAFVNQSKEEEETSEVVKNEEKKISFWQKVKRKLDFDKDGKNDYDS